MGIFFRTQPMAPRFARSAGVVKPQVDGEVIEQNFQEVGDGPPPPAQFLWGRLIFAVIVLAVLFAGGVYTAYHPELAAWKDLFVHSFELLFGALIGLLTGEASKSG